MRKYGKSGNSYVKVVRRPRVSFPVHTRQFASIGLREFTTLHYIVNSLGLIS